MTGEQAAGPGAKREKATRLFCLLMALAGTIVTALPFAFHLEPYIIPLLLVGCGTAVVALAVFLYFSI